jgi:hypothetical protein
MTSLDLAPITRHLRAMYGSRLLVTAVHHFGVFEMLQDGPLPLAVLQQRTGLAERPAMVLFPALCAMDLLGWESPGRLALTELGRYLAPATTPNLAGYAGLEKEDPGVLDLVQRLQHDGPADATEAIGYVKEGDAPSPMDHPEQARYLTLALAGRAQRLAPLVADRLPRRPGHLLDVAGGTGLFAYEWLLRNPEATATVMDRPRVLDVAREFLETLVRSGRPGAGTVPGRVHFLAGDMLTDPLPEADLLLAASLFHDWPTPTCRLLARRFAAALRPGGELWAHDAFLDDTLDGPLAVTDYSAALFCGTKGRCYSRWEYRDWFTQAGLVPSPDTFPTQLEYALIAARKPDRQK